MRITGTIRRTCLAAVLGASCGLFLATAAGAAECAGRDLIGALPAEQRAELDRAVDDVPYPTGIFWQATRGAAPIESAGTYHFPDPRHEATVARMAPLIAQAGALLVEAGPDEEAALTEKLRRDPSLMVDPTGPTLPERLGPAEWQIVAQAVEERGMPAVMASRLRPWYVAMLLGLSPCMMEQAQDLAARQGLDHRLIDEARDHDVPVLALEPWDTLFTLFKGMTPAEENDMIRAALPAARLADDYAATALEAYFRGDIRAVWEFGRLDALRNSGLPPGAVDRQVRLAEDRLMTRRNRSWIGPLTRAAEAAAARGKPVVAAFGALHLPGDTGVLRLLEAEGWTITRGGS